MRAARLGALMTLSALGWLTCTVRDGTLDPSFNPHGGSGGAGASAGHGGGGQGGTAGGGQGGTGGGLGGTGGQGACGPSCEGTLWEKTFADPGDQIATGLAVDHGSSVIVVGWYNQPFTFGTTSLLLDGSMSQAFVAKVASNGDVAWAIRSDGNAVTGQHKATAVAVDADDDIIVTGTFTGQIGFGDACPGFLQSLTTAEDTFIVKLSSEDGTCLWKKSYPGETASSTQRPQSLATDSAKNIWAVGGYDGKVHFDLPADTSTGGDDIFVNSIGSDGVAGFHGVYGAGALKNQLARAVALDATDRVYFAASYEGTINWNGNSHDAQGSNDVFIAGYEPGGAPFADADVQTMRNDAVLPAVGGMAVDSLNYLLLTGSYRGAGTGFGADLLPDSAATDAAYIVKFAPDGTVEWEQGYGDSNGVQMGVDVAVDGNDAVVALGAFHGSLAIGQCPVHTTASAPAAAADIYVAKLEVNGTCSWSKSFGGHGANEPTSIGADANGNVFIAGAYRGDIQFGPTPAPTSSSGRDLFLVKLAP
jgi:hypothetical protein